MINKQTKIVATISDLRADAKFIRELHDAGVDVMRLNTAFQTPTEATKVVNTIRAVSERIGILLDTKGPEIRTAENKEKIFLSKGETIKIKAGGSNNLSSRSALFVNYKHFVREVPKGARILIDDAALELVVEKKGKDYLLARAENEGEIKGFKSVNVPGVKLDLPSLSPKDKDFVAWAIKNDIDFIAHSFVRNKADVLAIQKILTENRSRIKIIAKIENQDGVDNIDEILDHAYGVMVARGDLGVEIPAEEVPLIQKMLIKKCIARQKPIITATQMLHTMIEQPRPTRAEVSDVANAVFDGTDALMLSGETAFGKHPLAAVRTMARIARHAEQARAKDKTAIEEVESGDEIADYLAKAAVLATHELPIKEIMVSSLSGFSANLIAAYRGKVPIFFKSPDKRRVRELSLTFGVYGHYFDKKHFNEKLIRRILQGLVKKGKLQPKDLIIHLSGDPRQHINANALEICQVGKFID